jgi:DNA-binding transcriptional LysR family regulator
VRLRHIEVFQAVYSSGSVTRAAEILNVSQPSVSKVLAHAEQQLGYALFDRLPKAIASYREMHSDTVFAVETLHHDEMASAFPV